MKLNKMFILLLSAVSLQTASAQMPNPLWLFRDSIPADSLLYYQLGLCDTPKINTGCFDPVDTGDNYNGKYINFNYQFTDGYAGFKIFWDSGLMTWNATKYDTMYLMHKGPLPGHKVKLFWGKSAAGGSVEWQLLGEFKSSTAWKKESFPFPENFIKTGLFELRMLIYNDSGVTSPTSGPGNLKIDDIAFIKGAGNSATRLRVPALSSPKNFSTINGTSDVLLSWRPSDSAKSYEVQVTRYIDTIGFITVLDSTLAETQVKTALSLPDETNLFNWRVRAKNPDDSSDWSDYWSFMVDLSSSTLYSPAHNPSELSAIRKAGSVTISIEMSSTCATGTITILNISGKKLAEKTISGPGLHTVTIPNIPAGVHFLRLNAGGKTIMRKALSF